MSEMATRASLTLLTVTLLFSLAGCRSGNPQPPAVKHAAHQRCAGHQQGKHGPGCGAQTDAAAQPGQTPMSFAEPPKVGIKARCPVAKQVFVVTADTTRSEHSNKHYVFCCGSCKNRFDANPDSFTGH